MKNKINIEEKLFPHAWEIREDSTVSIIDEELDEYECELEGDGVIKINTNGYEWITLSWRILDRLTELMEEYEAQNNTIRGGD